MDGERMKMERRRERQVEGKTGGVQGWRKGKIKWKGRGEGGVKSRTERKGGVRSSWSGRGDKGSGRREEGRWRS